MVPRLQDQGYLLDGQGDGGSHHHVLAAGPRPYGRQELLVVTVCLLELHMLAVLCVRPTSLKVPSIRGRSTTLAGPYLLFFLTCPARPSLLTSSPLSDESEVSSEVDCTALVCWSRR